MGAAIGSAGRGDFLAAGPMVAVAGYPPSSQSRVCHRHLADDLGYFLGRFGTYCHLDRWCADVATWSAGSQAFDEAASPWSSLTTSRIAAQQARTTETLALVRRDSEDDSVSFSQVESSIHEALDEFETTTPITTDSEELTSTQEAINTARESLDEWSTSHEAFVSALRTGRYDA